MLSIKLGKIIKKTVINQDNNLKHIVMVSKSSVDEDELSSILTQPGIIRKSQRKGFLTLRGGLIGVVISSSVMTITIYSIPFDVGITNPLRNYLTLFGFFGGILGMILFTLIFYLGVIFILYSKIRLTEINSTLLKQFLTNKKILVIMSIIVANFALSFIPQIFFFPLYGQLILFGGANSSFAFPLDVGTELEPFFLIDIVQGILEEPDLEPGILGRLIRLIAIAVLICTVCSLIWSLIGTIKEIKQLNEKMTFEKIIMELCFNVGILILLIFEIIGPFFLREVFIATPLSIFFLLFLITGNFERDYFVIENLTKIKSRLFFSILLISILMVFSLMLVSLPI
ncbi:MAG: hypothetical protein ACFFDT_27210 [Candidatus Hodarchaeota archaeon]